MPSKWRVTIAPYRRRAPLAQRLAFPYIITRRPEHETLLFVNSLVPAGLPEWIRADICQTMMLEILEGNLTKDRIDYATVSGFVRRIKVENWDYRTVSLDAPIGGAGDLRLVDVFADDPERLWTEP